MSAWPWPSSESTGAVIPAFVAALQAVEDVSRNKRAELDLKTGAKVRYGYADLDAVLEAVKPVLTTHGLAVTQPAANDGVHSILLHSSGEWLSFPPLTVTAGQATPQAQGSAISYGRRYQMLALLNIATEDDDGTAASKKPKAAVRQDRPAAPAPERNPEASGHDLGDRSTRSAGARPALNGDKPTPAMIRMAGALFNGRGWSEAQRHEKTAELVGHEVASWNDMSRAEFSAMLDKLKAAET